MYLQAPGANSKFGQRKKTNPANFKDQLSGSDELDMESPGSHNNVTPGFRGKESPDRDALNMILPSKDVHSSSEISRKTFQNIKLKRNQGERA